MWVINLCHSQLCGVSYVIVCVVLVFCIWMFCPLSLACIVVGLVFVLPILYKN